MAGELNYKATPRFKRIDSMTAWINGQISTAFIAEVDGNSIIIYDRKQRIVQVRRDFSPRVSLQLPNFLFETVAD